MNNMEKYCKQLKERCHKQGFNVSVFDALLPTTSGTIRGETMEERVQTLANSGRVGSVGGILCFLGTMMYNNGDMIRAREIARELKQKQKQEKDDSEDVHVLHLLKKAD